MKDWYFFVDGKLIFQLDTVRDLDPRVLETADWQLEMRKLDSLEITGKGTVWLYCRAGWEAARAGVRRITVKKPDETEPVVIWPRPAGACSGSWFQTTEYEKWTHFSLRYREKGWTRPFCRTNRLDLQKMTECWCFPGLRLSGCMRQRAYRRIWRG